MEQRRLKTFDVFLAEKLKDPKFARMYEKECRRFDKEYEIVTKQYAEKEKKIIDEVFI